MLIFSVRMSVRWELQDRVMTGDGLDEVYEQQISFDFFKSPSQFHLPFGFGSLQNVCTVRSSSSD